MVKTSQLLEVDHFQHCTAHALHLLLTVDSINTVDEVVAIIRKCKDVVNALHFKTEQLEDETAACEGKRVIDQLKAKMMQVTDIIDLGDQYPISDTDVTVEEAEHHYVTLKEG